VSYRITTGGATAKSEVGPRSSLRIPGGGRAYIIRDAYPQPHTQPQAAVSCQTEQGALRLAQL
jgi:hypothetical protein